MISILFDIMDKFLEIFMDFFILNSIYDECIYHLQLVLKSVKRKI